MTKRGRINILPSMLNNRSSKPSTWRKLMSDNVMPEELQDKESGDENKDNQQQKQNQDPGKNALLSYTIFPMHDAAAFVIHKQSPGITNFLRQLGIFRATNGMRKALANTFPEWKESDNFIFLDDGNGKQLGRPDITRFPVKGNNIRNGKISNFKLAIDEFIETYKALQSKEPLLESRNKDGGKFKVILK